MRFHVAAAAAASAVVLASCGSDEPAAISYPHQADDKTQIQAVVDAFNLAGEELDADILCSEVIAPSRRGGSVETCARAIGAAMKDAPENWKPITDVSGIEAKKNSATASGTQEDGSIALVFDRERGRWWMQVFD